ncbi:MAG TPA: acyl-ACP thioesterase [Clostridiaceae bacterium]|nr:acyl-ACP thioesterase [Clostridiaceae bacterium]
MENKILYKKKYNISFSDVDFSRRLKLSALFEYFQDIASLAADSLGVGIELLEKKYGVAWVLMRIYVEIIRTPAWEEEITIETWPQPPERLEFQRDFIVRDSNGNIIIKAISTWIILDTNSRKIKRADFIAEDYPAIVHESGKSERAMDCGLPKLKAPEQPEVAYRKTVGYSDIDSNEHLNNSRYVDFIMDCFDLASHKKYEVKSIDVNYINEALPGDTIILLKDVSKAESGLVHIEGIKENDGKVVFRSQVGIREKQL